MISLVLAIGTRKFGVIEVYVGGLITKLTQTVVPASVTLLLICSGAFAEGAQADLQQQDSQCSREKMREAAYSICILRIKADVEIAQAVQNGQITGDILKDTARGRGSGVTKATSEAMYKERVLLTSCDRTAALYLRAERIGKNIVSDALAETFKFTKADDFATECYSRLMKSPEW